MRSAGRWKFSIVLLVVPLAGCMLSPAPDVAKPVWSIEARARGGDARDCQGISNPWAGNGVWLANGVLLADEGDLVARNPHDGTELWRHHDPERCIQTWQHAGGDLVLLEARPHRGTRERDYFVTMLRAKDGQVRWRASLPDHAWSGTIAVAESAILVLADRIGIQLLYASWDVERFDARTGERRWSTPRVKRVDDRGQLSGGVWLLDESRYAVAYGSTLEHRSLASGELIEGIQTAWSSLQSPAVRADRVYDYGSGTIAAFSLEDGRQIWRRPLGVKRDWKGRPRATRHLPLQRSAHRGFGRRLRLSGGCR
jgi:outer membrane protein assembly factor BamB